MSNELFRESAGEIHEYRESPFVLASGRESHHYFNCKKITLLPDRLQMLVRTIRDELIPFSPLKNSTFEAIGGLTMGADPIAYALSLAYLEGGRTVFPLIVRKEAKGHGTGKQVEGELDRVKNVLLLDDVITTGGSSLKAVAAFRSVGLTVTDAICVVDREEGGRENLEKEGILLHSVYKKSDFVQQGNASH